MACFGSQSQPGWAEACFFFAGPARAGPRPVFYFAGPAWAWAEACFFSQGRPRHQNTSRMHWPMSGPILIPFWGRFGVIFGGSSGPPSERKHKENKGFWSCSSGPLFGAHFGPHVGLHLGHLARSHAHFLRSQSPNRARIGQILARKAEACFFFAGQPAWAEACFFLRRAGRGRAEACFFRRAGRGWAEACFLFRRIGQIKSCEVFYLAGQIKNMPRPNKNNMPPESLPSAREPVAHGPIFQDCGEATARNLKKKLARESI